MAVHEMDQSTLTRREHTALEPISIEIPSDPHPVRTSRSPLWILGILLAIGFGSLVTYLYLHASHFEKTDDAFVKSTITSISPQIAGRVVKVYVADNQRVKAGDLLVEIDTRPLEAQLSIASASAMLAVAKKESAEHNVSMTENMTSADIDRAKARIAAATAAVEQAQAAVNAAQAESERAQRDAARFESLSNNNAVSKQARDAATAQSQVASARVDEARKRLMAAQSDVDAARAMLLQAQTAPEQVAMSKSQVAMYDAEIAQNLATTKRIELDLSFTKLYAPHNGYVTTKSVNPGEFVQVGQALMSLVSSDLYVIANYKETQLTDMRPGQLADLKIDAFPDVHLKGVVDSIQLGTGAEFSLLPAQNATGNYIKVVQRVPVKIRFEEAIPAELPIVPGMSVVPKVLVR